MANLEFDINDFDSSNSYDLQIVSDVTGGTGGQPFKRNITSVEFDVDNTKVWEVPSSLYIPKNVCVGVNYIEEGWTLSNLNQDASAYVNLTNLILVDASNARDYVISRDQYDALAERANYREMPEFVDSTTTTEWSYTYSEGSSGTTNVVLDNGVYRVTIFPQDSNRLKITHKYLIGQLYYGGANSQSVLNLDDVKVGDLTKNNLHQTLYFNRSTSVQFETCFGGIAAQVVENDTINVFVRACKNPIGISNSSFDVAGVFSDSSNSYFDSYSFQCPSTIFGSASASDFSEATNTAIINGQQATQGTGVFYYTGDSVFFKYDAPTPIDPAPADPTVIEPDPENPTDIYRGYYVVKVDGVPVPDGRSVSFVENSNTEHVIALFAFNGTSEVQVTSGVSWVVEDLINLSSTPSTESSATLTYSSVCKYRITPRVNYDSNDVAVRDSFDFAIEEALVSPSALGLQIAMYPSTGGTPQYIELTEDQGGTGGYGTTYNATVPYRSEGYSFVLLDSNDNHIDGSSDGLTLQWFVEFPDGRNGFAFNRATLRDPSLLGGAGDYAIYAFVSGQQNNQNIGSYSVPVAKINLTIQSVINVSWIAVSYEG